MLWIYRSCCSAACLLVLAVLAGSCEERPQTGDAPRAKIVLRMGHFPNITHAQGLVAHALTRKGKGWFEERLGPDVQVDWYIYNAGPSAMEAIFAEALDVTYVGPSPAINAHARSAGEEIRIVAGAANGGAALVVQGDGRIKTPADFRGRKVATPEMGNTQDVACRSWLTAQGFKVTQVGGDVTVIPTANPEQLALFQKGDLDAVWTVEPWVSRLELEAGGKILLEEKDTVTTVLVSSVGCLKDRPELVDKIVKAHAELTEWIQKHEAEAQQLVSDELKKETSRELPENLLKRAWGRLRLTTEVQKASLDKFLGMAKEAGFLRELAGLSRLVETRR